jgi:hypothetical protein
MWVAPARAYALTVAAAAAAGPSAGTLTKTTMSATPVAVRPA